MRKKVILLFALGCAFSLVRGSRAAPTHLDKLKARYPFGLIGDDYGILTEEDLAINTCDVERTPFSRENRAYPYWQCFLTTNATIECEDTGYDQGEKSELAILLIEASNQSGLNTYTSRRAIHLKDCREWVREWKKKTFREKHVCISGPFGGSIGIRGGKKESDWVFDKFKTRKGCQSYFEGGCSLKSQAGKDCVLPAQK